MTILTPDWFAQFGAGPPEWEASERICYRIDAGGTNPTEFTLAWENDTTVVLPGVAERAAAILATDGDTFAELVAGTLGPVDALLAGRLRISGDMTRLLEGHRRLLALTNTVNS